MRTYLEEIPKYERVKNLRDYWEFVTWCATPTPQRKIKDQREFAKKYSIHETHLSKWKRMPEFRRDLIKVICQLMGDDLSDVMYAMRNKIYKEGNAAEVALYLKWATAWLEQIQFGDSEGTQGQDADKVKKLVSEFEKKLDELESK